MNGVCQCLAVGLRFLTGVDAPCADAPFVEIRDLITHQSDEWRKDDGDTVEENGRELETQGFSKSCLFYHQDSLAVEQCVDDFPLLVIEVRYSEFL